MDVFTKRRPHIHASSVPLFSREVVLLFPPSRCVIKIQYTTRNFLTIPFVPFEHQGELEKRRFQLETRIGLLKEEGELMQNLRHDLAGTIGGEEASVHERTVRTYARLLSVSTST